MNNIQKKYCVVQVCSTIRSQNEVVNLESFDVIALVGLTTAPVRPATPSEDGRKLAHVSKHKPASLASVIMRNACAKHSHALTMRSVSWSLVDMLFRGPPARSSMVLGWSIDSRPRLSATWSYCAALGGSAR
jgi:hypothetical protein